jgi:pimeloyl-ACP methyl ester carboxylesterase
MPEIELTAGVIEYDDTGSGPTVVLLHGVATDRSLWRHVVADLGQDFRCVVPTLPLGGHRRPMLPEADLSLSGLAALVAEFLERLGLQEVTLVQNDAGVGLKLASQRPQRVSRLVIASCEAFENYPPGLPGRTLALAAKIPGGLNALAQPMRLRPLRRLPVAYGWMSKRPIPDAVTDAWLRPLLTSREVRRDLVKYLRSARTAEMAAATQQVSGFTRPVLVAWAAEDRVMPSRHGRRLAELVPDGRLVQITDSYTLIPEDQPRELARAIRAFITETS